jgi:hypothetical protein
MSRVVYPRLNVIRDSLNNIHRRNRRLKRRHNEKIRMTLVQNQNNLCNYCGERLKVNGVDDDHIIPLMCRGSDEFGNHQALCVSCHASKSRIEMNIVNEQNHEYIRKVSRFFDPHATYSSTITFPLLLPSSHLVGYYLSRRSKWWKLILKLKRQEATIQYILSSRPPALPSTTLSVQSVLQTFRYSANSDTSHLFVSYKKN